MEEKYKKKLINQVKMVVRTEFPDFDFGEWGEKEFDCFINLAEEVCSAGGFFCDKFGFLWLVISVLYQAESVRIGEENLREVYFSTSEYYWNKFEVGVKSL